jgi:hypothetical protein
MCYLSILLYCDVKKNRVNIFISRIIINSIKKKNDVDITIIMENR